MRMLLAMTILALTGCGASPTAPVAPANDAAVVAPPAPPAPTATPSSGATTADTADAAAEVVRQYHARIAARDYDTAYHLWEPGAVGVPASAFAASFAKYADYRADVGTPGAIDAGAGQRYVTIPVRVTGHLTDGGGFALVGSMTLHRVADIDGATPEQRGWRIRSSALKPRPGDAPVSGPGTTGRVTARYRCIDGNRLVALFDNDAGTVTLRRGGERIGVLARQPAASGISYTGNGLDLRGRGDAATFSEPGKPPIACTVIR